MAVGNCWEELKYLDSQAHIDVVSSSEALGSFTKALEEENPYQLMLWDIHSEEELREVFVLGGARGAMVVSVKYGIAEPGRESLTQLLHSEKAADYIQNKATPSSIPFLVLRTEDSALAEKLRLLGEVDAVISSGDDLRSHYWALKSAAFSRTHAPVILQADAIAESLPRVQRYINLRELENVTADTRQTLENFLTAIEGHRQQAGIEIRTVLEAGVGEGRIAIPLILMGYKVIGVDISKERLPIARVRLLEEVEEFVRQGGPREGSLAYIAWEFMDEEQRAKRREELAKILQDFALEGNLEQFLAEDFITEQERIQLLGKAGLEILAKERPQAVIFAWNTFNFMGGPDQMVRVLRRVYDVLPPGGFLFIEIPDRETGPYPEILREYLRKHPEALPGMSEARPETRGELYVTDEKAPGAARYFPAEGELAYLLGLSGFKVTEIRRHEIVPKVEELKDQAFEELTFVASRV